MCYDMSLQEGALVSMIMLIGIYVFPFAKIIITMEKLFSLPLFRVQSKRYRYGAAMRF